MVEMCLNDKCNNRDKIMGYEGEAAKIYFYTLRDVLPETHYKGIRSRRPPEDIFNACLGYGYGILYGVILKGCIFYGLDPDIGILHSDGSPSLVLDLIEPFRQPVVDRIVLRLCLRNEIGVNDAVVEENGTLLNKRGRSKLAETVLSELSKPVGKNNKSSVEETIHGMIKGAADYIDDRMKEPNFEINEE